jgi:hypothetical protein
MRVSLFTSADHLRSSPASQPGVPGGIFGARFSPLSGPPHLMGGRRLRRRILLTSAMSFSISALRETVLVRGEVRVVRGELGVWDLEVAVLTGAVLIARVASAPVTFALGLVAVGVVVGLTVTGDLITVVVVGVVLAPQPATKHRATSTANPQPKVLTAGHFTRSRLWTLPLGASSPGGKPPLGAIRHAESVTPGVYEPYLSLGAHSTPARFAAGNTL